MYRRRWLGWTSLLPLLATACSGSSLELQTQIGIGELALSQEIAIPTSVKVGQGFLVKVITVGDGCVDHASTQLAVNGLVATIIPLDEFNVTAGVPCQSIGKSFNHYATVRFYQTGQALVRVQGSNGQMERTLLVQ